LFQKEFRLRVLTDWDEQNWQEIFDTVKVDWSLVLGAPLSGKTTLTQTLRKALGGPSRVTVFDQKELETTLRAQLAGPEGEPFEGKVPLQKLEEAVSNTIARDKKAGKRVTYVFDGFPGQPNATEFARFVRDKLKCPPDYVVSCSVQQDGGNVLQQRFKKRLEMEGDLSEEQVEAFRASMLEYQENVETYITSYAEQYIESGRTKLVQIDTTATSEETVANSLRDAMAPKVILVNHEKRLPVDAICANAGIKYSFMYISVYQLIR
jgi:adenylate kinase family enzyme